MNANLPIIDCWVARPNARHRIGRVAKHLEHNAIMVDFGPDSSPETIPEGDWVCGLQPGFTVQDVPLSASRRTLGTGTIVNLRAIGGAEQAAVQLHATGELRWLPFERLKRIMDPRLQFIRDQKQADEAAERTALHLMGQALRTWNEATGALERLDTDPLPHQLTLVHRILSSGNTNWVIADDEALGKTTEIGLILGALERRQGLERVLILAPAALNPIWQEDLGARFGKPFEVYGRDFLAAGEGGWTGRHRVIAPLEAMHPEAEGDDGTGEASAFGRLLSAGNWDLVVIDQAHLLIRDDSDRTRQRYRLAEELRSRCDAMLLLTGVPHQGDLDRFRALLKLVRPDLAEAIVRIGTDDDVVAQIVLRSSRMAAQSADGRPLFEGAVSRRVDVVRNAEAVELERRLSSYLRRGYRAADEIGGDTGKAISLLLTVYRKLASSSPFALALALARRRSQLLGEQGPGEHVVETSDLTFDSMAEIGEGDDLLGDAEVPGATQFHDDEPEQLSAIIEQTKRCFHADPRHFEFRRIIDEVVIREKRKLVVFTEYRATQAYLATRLEQALGMKAVLVHSGLSAEERAAAVASFAGDAQVLIATETAGEGLALERHAQVMVNYDMPWNTARLAHRIGRLARPGQAGKVVVVSLLAKDTIDNEVLSTLVERVDAMVRKTATVNGDISDRYQSDILLDLYARIETNALLSAAGMGQVDRILEAIESAIEGARGAKLMQEAALSETLDGGEAGWAPLGRFTTADLAIFVRRAAERLGVVVSPYRDEIERFDLRLPPELVGRFPEFGNRSVIDCRTVRGTGPTGRTPLDFASSFVRYLVHETALPDFGGGYGVLPAAVDGPMTLAAFSVRFQNDQGEPRGVELVVARRGRDGAIELDNGAIRPLFDSIVRDGRVEKQEATTRAQAFDAMLDRIEVRVADATTRFRYPNGIFCAGILTCDGTAPIAPLAPAPDLPDGWDSDEGNSD